MVMDGRSILTGGHGGAELRRLPRVHDIVGRHLACEGHVAYFYGASRRRRMTLALTRRARIYASTWT